MMVRMIYSRGYYGDRRRDHCNGMLELGREIGLNSENNKDKWDLLAKEQGGGQWMENY